MTWCARFGWVDFYDRLEQTGVGSAIRESLWLMPAIWAVHLVGLAALGGSILVVDLRLLGAGLARLSPAEVSANARPWFLASLALMLVTGVLLFLSEAVKCCFNDSFEVKIAALLLGVAFTFAVRGPMAARAKEVRQEGARAWALRGVGAASLGLWFTVAAAGRWIGFSG